MKAFRLIAPYYSFRFNAGGILEISNTKKHNFSYLDKSYLKLRWLSAVYSNPSILLRRVTSNPQNKKKLWKFLNKASRKKIDAFLKKFENNIREHNSATKKFIESGKKIASIEKIKSKLRSSKQKEELRRLKKEHKKYIRLINSASKKRSILFKKIKSTLKKRNKFTKLLTKLMIVERSKILQTALQIKKRQLKFSHLFVRSVINGKIKGNGTEAFVTISFDNNLNADSWTSSRLEDGQRKIRLAWRQSRRYRGPLGLMHELVHVHYGTHYKKKNGASRAHEAATIRVVNMIRWEHGLPLRYKHSGSGVNLKSNGEFPIAVPTVIPLVIKK